MSGAVSRYSSEPPHTEGDGFRAVAAALDALRDEIGTRHVENTSSLEVLEKDVKVLIEQVDRLAKGFPEDDPDGHRRMHEALIEKAKARTELYRDLQKKLLERGVLAVLGAIAVAIWFYVKSRLNS
jgi:C4-dicarboxylate-specific signal transduction histidine kinase